MDPVTTFLIVVPVVMVIVTFLPPYSRLFGFDQVEQGEAAPKPLPQLEALPALVPTQRAEATPDHVSERRVADLLSVVQSRRTPQLPAPQVAKGESTGGIAYAVSAEVEEAELVDIPEDWKQGGKHARGETFRYVDFSELDRYAIADESEAVAAAFEDPEVLDVVRGFWAAPEDLTATV
ncbi:hypothetical protein H8Z72_22825 (plasmid) [Xanthomonas citri pv. citri]|uniref:hypothetical protein n=1 Tax=Xanthomonas citri TaxID=346 RepID=UPI00193232C3|nr:hypothetical protein [Xanthomonas citri]QRD62635.1 hypothetical protein H8Z74_23360 [Xanthomonas citri pv. citri]QRD67170.1 hypothetical protein H8Z73_22340 [Xanthomonas citri pv. citri]QRD71785.1 hypothetical protein H8Z72_22825 [Xanthomonas citri pv. citri]